MDDVELTPIEWEWFKQLARSRPVNQRPPTDIRRKLVELRLMEDKPGGAFGPTTEGRAVLKLVDGRWRGGYKWREPRGS